ncbi:MAG TPA: hypothetical protein VM901_12520 [Bdellovibrionota bacterium]|jgi:hypothetical protein|nr:hypothetical protein [Bdellovibrionota bacterium]
MKKYTFVALMAFGASTLASAKPLSAEQKLVVKDLIQEFRTVFETLSEVRLKGESGALYLGLEETEKSESMAEQMRRCESEHSPDDDDIYLSTGEHKLNYELFGDKCPMKLKAKGLLNTVKGEPKGNGSLKIDGEIGFEVTSAKFQALTDLKKGNLVAAGSSKHDTKLSEGAGGLSGKFTSVKHGEVGFAGNAKAKIEGGKLWQDRRSGEATSEIKFTFKDFSFELKVDIKGATLADDGKGPQVEPDYSKNFTYYVNGEKVSREKLLNEYFPKIVVDEIEDGWPAMSFHDALKHGHNPWIHYE